MENWKWKVENNRAADWGRKSVVSDLHSMLEFAIMTAKSELKSKVENDVERRKKLDEILAPIRKNFADSGMTEDELDELIESELKAMRQEKKERVAAEAQSKLTELRKLFAETRANITYSDEELEIIIDKEIAAHRAERRQK